MRVSRRTRTRIFNLKLRFFLPPFFPLSAALKARPLWSELEECGVWNGVGKSRYTVWQNSFEPGSAEAVNALTDLQTFYLYLLTLEL